MMTPPLPSSPLLRAIRRQAVAASSPAVKLSDFPELALAASATTAALDTSCETFHAVQGCLETLCRLKLNKRAALALMVLARHGPQKIGVLAASLKTTAPNASLVVRRLTELGLITADRDLDDARQVNVAVNDAGRKVVASVVALSALAGASAVLLNAEKLKR